MSFYTKFKSFWGSADAVDKLTSSEESDGKGIESAMHNLNEDEDSDPKDIASQKGEDQNDQEGHDNNDKDGDGDGADREDDDSDEREDGKKENNPNKDDNENSNNDGDDTDREDDDSDDTGDSDYRDESDTEEEDPPKIAKPVSLASQVIDVQSEDDAEDAAVDLDEEWDPYCKVSRKKFLGRTWKTLEDFKQDAHIMGLVMGQTDAKRRRYRLRFQGGRTKAKMTFRYYTEIMEIKRAEGVQATPVETILDW